MTRIFRKDFTFVDPDTAGSFLAHFCEIHGLDRVNVKMEMEDGWCELHIWLDLSEWEEMTPIKRDRLERPSRLEEYS